MLLFGIAVVSGIVSWWLTGKLAALDAPLLSLDHPNERSLHQQPTPRTGGVAILVGLFLGLLAYEVATRSSIGTIGWWILAMTGIISVMSFLDDRIGLPVSLRLGIQLVIASALAMGLGLLLPTLEIPLVVLLPWGWLAIPLTTLFIVWMTNLYNFMDGIDGFAGGMTTVGFGCLAYLGWRANHNFLLVTALLLSVASTGFLLHNFPPAKIFMGDVGSVSIGFLGASLMLLGWRDGVFAFWVPILLFSPFILDATITVAKRAIHGKKIWEAHREHYYQRLVLSGWTHRQTVLMEYGLMVFCVGAAILYHHATERWRLATLAAGLMVLLAFGVLVNRVEQRAKNKGEAQ